MIYARSSSDSLPTRAPLIRDRNLSSIGWIDRFGRRWANALRRAVRSSGIGGLGVVCGSKMSPSFPGADLANERSTDVELIGNFLTCENARAYQSSDAQDLLLCEFGVPVPFALSVASKVLSSYR